MGITGGFELVERSVYEVEIIDDIYSTGGGISCGLQA
jgi:hypothetical protein